MLSLTPVGQDRGTGMPGSRSSGRRRYLCRPGPVPVPVPSTVLASHVEVSGEGATRLGEGAT
jgi:hypothetical protein